MRALAEGVLARGVLGNRDDDDDDVHSQSQAQLVGRQLYAWQCAFHMHAERI